MTVVPPARPRRRLSLGLVLAAILLPRNALPQSSGMSNPPESSHPVADSAAAARARYRASLVATRSGDLAGALEEARSASRAWPSQPAYHALVASLAARAADTLAAVAELDQLTALGAAHPVPRDPDFDLIREAEPVRAALARMAAATAPLANSAVVATVGPADFFAEGLAVGPDGSLYVGSVRHRQILRRFPDGREVALVPPGDSIWAVSGLALAPDGRSLWATSNAIPQMVGFTRALEGRSELVAVALDGSGVLARHPVAAGSGGAMLGDVHVAPGGIVYATDTRTPALWRLAPGNPAPQRVAHHPLLRSPQGMALSNDGSALLVADYSHGLLRVNLQTGAVEPLGVPEGTTVLGIDGLARDGQDLIAIQNGGVVPRVIRIRLDASEHRVVGLEAIDRNLAIADEPTLGVVAGGSFLYVANSQWEKRGEDGTPKPGAVLAPTVILGVPLVRPSPRSPGRSPR